MKSYLFLSGARRSPYSYVSMIVEKTIKNEDIDKIVINGDFSGAQNKRVQNIKAFYNVKDNTCDINTIISSMMQTKVSFIELVGEKVYNKLKDKFGNEKISNFLSLLVEQKQADFFVDYPYITLLGMEFPDIKKDIILGCDEMAHDKDYSFYSEHKYFKKTTLFDNFLYIPGSNILSYRKCVLSTKHDNKQITLMNRNYKTGYTTIPDMIEVDYDGKDMLRDYMMMMVKENLPVIEDYLYKRFLTFYSSNPLDFVNKLDDKSRDSLENKVIVSHIPLGDLYDEIGSNKRIVAHGIKPGKGIDTKGNPVTQGEWVDNLVLNPSDVDNGVISVVYVDGDEVGYRTNSFM